VPTVMPAPPGQHLTRRTHALLRSRSIITVIPGATRPAGQSTRRGCRERPVSYDADAQAGRTIIERSCNVRSAGGVWKRDRSLAQEGGTTVVATWLTD
jgi:hypothetical protein